ncbi:DUF1592 domain-containing protein [Rubripirellula amarantea]|nr:DUF1592 domain-containing protein [Rubripirellula amarantea]
MAKSTPTVVWSHLHWALAVLLLQLGVKDSQSAEPNVDRTLPTDFQQKLDNIEDFFGNHCLECHSSDAPAADFDLDSVDLARLAQSPAEHHDERAKMELVFKRVASRQMPPPSHDSNSRPDDETYTRVTHELGDVLDHAARLNPAVPRVDTLRRLTRTEYQNSIRDLLSIEIAAADWLPADESSQGFDNITTRELSPALVSRYLTAAQHVARIAVARPTGIPMGMTVRLPADLTQEHHLDGLPLGTRGGVNIRHTFAESGVYEVAIRLTRDRDEMVEGLFQKHDIDVLVDRDRRDRISVFPPKDGKDYTHVDTNLKSRVNIDAGQHDLAVTFVSQGDSLVEIKRQPFDAAYNRHRHPRQQPAIFEVSVYGPLLDESPASEATHETPTTISRDKIFGNHLEALESAQPSVDEQMAIAEGILRPIMRSAYRREIEPADVVVPMQFFRNAIETNITTNQQAKVTSLNQDRWRIRFDMGIETALSSILVNPHFFLRTEAEVQQDVAAEPISDQELATRLSFFLWSSIPDAELLDLAKAKRLHEPEILRHQVHRMLADPKSDSLVNNFASQWLHLRNLDSIAPDLRQFPDFDENLRRAFRRETELLFEHVKKHDLSVLKLIDSDITFLNDRLAKHYGIAGIRGNHFREVSLRDDPTPEKARRGGLLRQGSILSVTSYATRTSPTIRGNWVLKNLLGTPPPPPPPNVPALKEKSATIAETVRERLALHRSDSACASCHDLIDPVGFALDRFDAVGRWRAYDGDLAVDASGVLPDGTPVTGVGDLEASLLGNPDQFVSAMAEKLMTFGLGRGVDYRDAATIRNVVASSRANEYQFSSIIQAIVASDAFLKRSPNQESNVRGETDDE